MAAKRNYKKEYANYHSKPAQKKKRAQRNTARKRAEKAGKVRKGDGKDIDHKKPLRSGGSNAKSNTRVRSRSANRADNGGKGGRPKKRGNRK
jgi:hypothetical protein